jgi:hypothetical protein
MNDKRRT